MLHFPAWLRDFSMASSNRHTSRSASAHTPTDSEPSSSRWKVALIGAFVMAIAALLGLAFLTYHPEDDPLTKQLALFDVLVAPESHQAVYRVQNALGLTGAELARRGLQGFLGYPVLLPTALLMIWGFVLARLPSFSTSQLRSLGRASALVGAGTLVVSTALGWLDHALSPPDTLAAWAGGWGLGIAGWMSHVAGTVGSLLLLVLMSGLLLVLTFDLSLTKTIRRGKRGVEWGSEVADAARQRVVPALRRLQSRGGDSDERPALPSAPLSLPAAADATDPPDEERTETAEETAQDTPPADPPLDAEAPPPSAPQDLEAAPDRTAETEPAPPSDEGDTLHDILNVERASSRDDVSPEQTRDVPSATTDDASAATSDADVEDMFGDVLEDVPLNEPAAPDETEPSPPEDTPPEDTPSEETPSEDTPSEETPSEETPSKEPDAATSDAPSDAVAPSLEAPTFSLDVLKATSRPSPTPDRAAIDTIQQHVVDVLRSFNVTIDDASAVVGPSVVRFDVTPGSGTLPSHIKALADDLPDAFGVTSLRMVTPHPDAPVVGIELPRPRRHAVPLRSLLTSAAFQETENALPLALGQSITNDPVCPDLTSLPHLLTAGAPNTGRTDGLHALLLGLLYHAAPSSLRMLFIDPDGDTLAPYAPLHAHYGAVSGPVEAPVVSASRDVLHTLMACERELDARLSTAAPHVPRLVVVVSTLAPLMSDADCTDSLLRLLHEGASAGIHLLLSTHAPTPNVLPRNLRSLLAHRVAYAVSSRLESRAVLDTMGAERLMGRGDLLYRNGPRLDRLQGPLVDGDTVARVVDALCTHPATGTYALS